MSSENGKRSSIDSIPGTPNIASASSQAELGVPGCKGCKRLQEKCEHVKAAWRVQCVKEVNAKMKEAADHEAAEREKLEAKLREAEEHSEQLQKHMEAERQEHEAESQKLAADRQGTLDALKREQMHSADLRRQLQRAHYEKNEFEEHQRQAERLIHGYAGMRAEAMELLDIFADQQQEADDNVQRADVGVQCALLKDGKGSSEAHTLAGIGKMANRIGRKRAELEKAINFVNELAASIPTRSGSGAEEEEEGTSSGTDGRQPVKKARRDSLLVEDPAPAAGGSLELMMEDEEEIMVVDTVDGPKTPPRTDGNGTPTDPNQQPMAFGEEALQTRKLFSPSEEEVKAEPPQQPPTASSPSTDLTLKEFLRKRRASDNKGANKEN